MNLLILSTLSLTLTPGAVHNTIGSFVNVNQDTDANIQYLKSKMAIHRHCKLWINPKQIVPLKDYSFFNNCQLLKKIEVNDVVKIEGRWNLKKINYPGMLTDGKNTDFIVNKIAFNPSIPNHIFSEEVLKR